MSTPHSSAAVRAPGLTVPPTQGTAPVIKFRCLFTHDVRRKAKRWQDGFLRFHTFNKRVMVYDNGGYFIGDLHYRAPEGIQEGDELELDKGVLIQVCEPLEQTETDLSSLHRNKNTTSPSHAPETPSSVHRPTPRPLPSQQASRSLNDLLGIRKTPAPQTSSPYQQRQRPASTPQHERPAKRQRAASPERTGPTSTRAVIDLSNSPPRRQQAPASEPQQNPFSRPQGISNTAVRGPQLHTASSVNDSSKQDGTPQNGPLQSVYEQAPRPINNGPTIQTPHEPTSGNASRHPGDSQTRPRQPVPPDQRQQTTTLHPANSTIIRDPLEPNRDHTSRQSESSQNQLPLPVAGDPRPSLGPDLPLNPLRISCGNPRRKLMYRESQSRPSQCDPDIKLEPSSSDFMFSDDDELFTHHNLGVNQLEPRIQPSEIRQVKNEEDPPMSFDEASGHQNAVRNVSMGRSSNNILLENRDPQTSTTSGPLPLRSVPSPLRTCAAEPSRNPLANTRTGDRGPGSTFGASSNNSMPSNRQPGHFPDAAALSNPIVKGAPSLPIAPFIQPQGRFLTPRPTVLRKSFSDPSTINSLQGRPLTPATNSPLNHTSAASDTPEQGPWTSEALDLFDFWPPGRPKPT
ncbi:hypothetical protein BJX64DRAFT_153107 [Aspergillus heterothallicus]